MSSKMLAIQLARQGNKVLFLSHSLPEENHTPNLEIDTWPNNRPNTFRSALWLWHLLRKNKTQIVLAHNAAINVVAVVSLLTRIQYRLAYYHSAYEASLMDITASAFWVWLRRLRKGWVYRCYHQLVCVSQFAAADAQQWFDVRPNKCIVIYNALLDRGKNPLPKPDSGHGLQFFSAGRMDAGKNVEQMVLGFLAFAQKHNTPCRLWIAGEGPLAPAIQSLANEHPKYLKYLGGIPYPQVDEFIQNSHAVVASTKAEAFGMTVLESLMLGTPVLANETGGIPEIMQHQKHGLFVKGFLPIDWEDGFEKMAAAIGNKNLYAIWQKACRERYLELFTAESQLARLVDILNKKQRE
jgi:glycosyltransferase involved in cell wall biosynthesis